MSFLGKILVFLNLILAILYAGISAVLYTQRVDYRSEIRSLKDETKGFEDFMSKKFYLESNKVESYGQKNLIPTYITIVEKVHSEIDTLKTKQENQVSKIQLESDQKSEKIDDMENRLKKEISKRMSLEQAARDADIERKKLLGSVENLTNRLGELSRAKVAAESELKTFKIEHDALYVKHLSMISKVARLQEELKSADLESKRSGSEISRITREVKKWRTLHPNEIDKITGTGEVGKGKQIRGLVLGVRPELNLVIINKGGPDGVRPGTQFIVYRGNDYVGRIEVDKVLGEYASGKILISKLSIEQGDKVANYLER